LDVIVIWRNVHYIHCFLDCNNRYLIVTEEHQWYINCFR